MNYSYKEHNKTTNKFSAIRIQLASPERIREWSYGEVTKPETINYRSFKPERDGLFCEKIFGPVKDWECSCGKYKRIRYRGMVCDRCGVEITQSKVRRERLGHIELAVPVSHIWYFKGLPSRIGNLLNVSVSNLEKVLYYENYIVIDPGDSPLQAQDFIDEDEYIQMKEEYGDSFIAKMGAEALKDLLSGLDIEELSQELRTQVKVETSFQRKKDILKRLKVTEAFRKSENLPEWMVLEVIPVIPPDLRPLVPLEGGRFATSDLNDLYRRVINRNNRLKKLMDLRAPEVILRNEKRMLQEAVDSLLDNDRRRRAVRGRGNRPLKSLTNMLKGKVGRFRQNLLGKRVDYSGRSVIVVGPELKMHQCGLPKTMALELFKPFIIRKLEDEGHAQTIKSAKRLVEREIPEVWGILENIIQDHPVLLNRAPTLHRLGIQAFEPVLVEGKAIKLHPLVCAAFNADFDGDQMAVHVPLSLEAQLEAKILMLAANNILLPASGKAVAAPTKDIVLGCYYLTKERRYDKGEGKIFANIDEVVSAFDNKIVGLHARIKVRGLNKVREHSNWTEKDLADIEDWKDYTTVGRVLFNMIVPDGVNYVNDVCNKNRLSDLVGEVHNKLGSYHTVQFLDSVKKIGFYYATIAGITVSIEDMVVPPEKDKILDKSRDDIERVLVQYRQGVITDGERYNKVIDIWTRATNDVAEVMFERLEESQEGFNPIFMMADSGARGSKDQIKQLAGMRGLMAKPQKKITGQIGEIIESPITSNFREGLSVLEYFISTHGARKGLADTALKTADAGYLTRRLVDVAQDAIVTMLDCDTIRGVWVGALKEGEEIIEPISDRIIGRFALDDVTDPITGELLVKSGEEINEEKAMFIEEAGIDNVFIRSVLTCEAKRGICVKCYGMNLATGRIVEIGEAVGVIAAQSIGEPGTQLTLRTFHIGGTAARIAEQSKAEAKADGTIQFNLLNTVINRIGKNVITSRNSEIIIIDDEGRIRVRYSVPYGAVLEVNDAQKVLRGDVLFAWDPYINPIITDKKGKVKYVDMVEETTLREELDETTGLRQRVIIEDREKLLHPHIKILNDDGEVIGDYALPTGAHIMVHDGDDVEGGDLLVKIPREISKTKDITGGLPRVAELFEARKPKSQAIVTDIEGVVEFGGVVRKLQRLIVRSDSGMEQEYLMPHGKHLRVHEGDRVKAGDRLCEGPINPHDILRIKGENEVQKYLVNEIQEVYRLQGVRTNDKHIEVIVRQMLKKVRIKDPGDTNFLEDESVDKVRLKEENEKVMQEGGEPASFEPILLGITKASLGTESFISAASFQETTRVLTEAAIRGRTDYLRGLKENVIIGHLIPAGTGIPRYSNLNLIENEEYNVIDEPEEEEITAGK